MDAGATTVLGTSHRQSTIKQIVGSIRAGLAEFLRIPDDYEIVLGNGGATAFWDMACASLITRWAAFWRLRVVQRQIRRLRGLRPVPGLYPVVYRREPGDCRLPEYTEYVDAYCWAHNETSTGVAAPVHRIAGSLEQGALTIVDATSAAGALPVDISQTDAYYFSPQEAFGSDGGLWIVVSFPRGD